MEFTVFLFTFYKVRTTSYETFWYLVEVRTGEGWVGKVGRGLTTSAVQYRVK